MSQVLADQSGALYNAQTKAADFASNRPMAPGPKRPGSDVCRVLFGSDASYVDQEKEGWLRNLADGQILSARLADS